MLFLREFTKLISGKSVVIIGSGPNPILPDHIHDPDTTIICVKASGYIAKKLGVRDPDVTFQSEWAFDDNLELMRGLKAGYTLQVWRQQNNYDFYYEKYKNINFDYGKLQLLPNNLLPAFYLTDGFEDAPNEAFSYGLGVLFFCANLNAKDVTLVGFNPFVRKRSYESDRPVLDIHEKIDSYLITNFHNQLDIDISICDKELAKKLNINYRKPID